MENIKNSIENILIKHQIKPFQKNITVNETHDRLDILLKWVLLLKILSKL